MSEHVVQKSAYGDMDPNEVRRVLVREMNRAGAYRLEGEYSGGHDEGGLDSLAAYDKDGEAIEITGGYDHALWQAVEDLLSTKFYSWALECSVYGHVYADLKEKRAWTEGSMEVTDYQSDDDPIEMAL